MSYSNEDLDNLKADVQFPNLRRYSESAKEESVKAERFVKFPDSFAKVMNADVRGVLSFGSDVIESWNVGYVEERWNVSSVKDAIELLKEARLWDFFPKDCITFADDECGNYLVFKKACDDVLADQVFFWSHETGELTKIADDFNDLLVYLDVKPIRPHFDKKRQKKSS